MSSTPYYTKKIGTYPRCSWQVVNRDTNRVLCVLPNVNAAKAVVIALAEEYSIGYGCGVKAPAQHGSPPSLYIATDSDTDI